MGFVGFLCCNDFRIQIAHPIISVKNCRWWSNWHIYLLVYNFLQISSQSLSRYNELGVYHRGWWRSILFDRTSILSVEKAVHRPNAPYLDVSSTFTCTMQDVVWTNQALVDLCDSYAWGSRQLRVPSVFLCWYFVLPLLILNCWWRVHWLQIQYDKCTRRNCSESTHCPAV